MKKQKGITLIALVITIIVLLILAGVTIATLTGDNGLLTKATDAKKANEKTTLEEQIKLSYLEYEIEKKTNPNVNFEQFIKSSLEKIFNESITTEKVGNSLKVTFNERNKKYKYRPNGTIIELMDPTDVYAKLDADGTIYLRATKINDNYNKIYNRMPTYDEIKKVIIEEPIAPNGSISQMFYPCRNLTSIENMNYLHTENVTNMAGMFSTCKSLENIDVSGFDTSSVTNMDSMFSSCNALREIDVSNFDTSQVTSMSWMFGDCKLLTKLDLSNFDTSNVTNIAAMLCGLSYITKLDLSNFNTSNVDTISSLFAGTPLRELNLGRNFVLKQNLSTNGMEFSKVPNSVKITTTRSTADRLKQIKPSFTDANFIIID